MMAAMCQVPVAKSNGPARKGVQSHGPFEQLGLQRHVWDMKPIIYGNIYGIYDIWEYIYIYNQLEYEL